MIETRFLSLTGCLAGDVSASLLRFWGGTVIAHALPHMNAQLMFGLGGALLAVFAFHGWRFTRDDLSVSAVSETWLAERRRIKEEGE